MSMAIPYQTIKNNWKYNFILSNVLFFQWGGKVLKGLFLEFLWFSKSNSFSLSRWYLKFSIFNRFSIQFMCSNKNLSKVGSSKNPLSSLSILYITIKMNNSNPSSSSLFRTWHFRLRLLIIKDNLSKIQWITTLGTHRIDFRDQKKRTFNKNPKTISTLYFSMFFINLFEMEIILKKISKVNGCV